MVSLVVVCTLLPMVACSVSPTLFTVKMLTDVMLNGEPAPPVVINVTRYFAPNSADRFLQLVRNEYFTSSGFYRVRANHSVQFGVASTPEITAMWRTPIPDDKPFASNGVGTLAFVSNGSQPDSRTTHIVISLQENAGTFDQLGLAPFGEVVEGLDVLRHITDPGSIDAQLYAAEGHAWFLKSYPTANLITNATVVYASIPLNLSEQSLIIQESNDGVPVWTLAVALMCGILIAMCMIGLVFCSRTIMKCLVKLLGCCGCNRLSLVTWLKWYLRVRDESLGDEAHDPLSLGKVDDVQRLDGVVLDASMMECETADPYGDPHGDQSFVYNDAFHAAWDNMHGGDPMEESNTGRLDDLLSYNTKAPSFAKPHPAYAVNMVPFGGDSARSGCLTGRTGGESSARKNRHVVISDNANDNPDKDLHDTPYGLDTEKEEGSARSHTQASSDSTPYGKRSI